MPFDGFLKISGIEGESKDSKHGKEIDVLNFTYGVTQSTSVATGGGLSAGKSTLTAFTFNQTYHKGSVPLFLAAATGKHIDKVTFTARKSAGDNQLEYLVVDFEDCLVTSIQISGGQENEIPNETVEIAYSKIKMKYYEQKKDGSAMPPVEIGYDQKANKKT
jgi:type VI secretion system secreted protein Hcp